MKIYVTILVIMVSLGSIFGISYAFTVAPSSVPSLPQTSLQYVVRDSHGTLVGYLEPSVWFIRDVGGVHKYLDTLKPQSTTQKDGKTLQSYVIQSSEGFGHFGQFTEYNLWYGDTAVIVVNNNGYLAGPGDTNSVSWKLVRIAQ